MTSIRSFGEYLSVYYSKKDYESDKNKVKDLVLHYLIALNQPESTILSLIEKLLKNNPHRLTYHDPRNGLTPLWMAVIYDRQSVVKALDSHGATLISQDRFKFTPLHYAALKQDGFLEELIGRVDKTALEQLKKLRCQFGGTYEDIQRLARDQMDPAEVVAYYQNEKLTAEQLQKMTGAQFGTRAFYEELLKAHEQQVSKSDYFVLPVDHPTVIQFKKNPPPLALIDEPSMGLGVQSLDSIKQGSIVCSFGGVFVADSSSNQINTYEQSLYSISSYDASKWREVGAYVNDGPPNVMYADIQNDSGLPKKVVLIALEDISPQEKIYVYYGKDHPLRDSNYVLTKEMLEKLKKVFRHQKLMNFYGAYQNVFGFFSKLVRSSQTSSSAWMEEKLSDLQAMQMFLYVLNTPKVFLQLHILKILKIKETILFLEKIKEKFKYCPHYLFILNKIKNFGGLSEELTTELMDMGNLMTGRAFTLAMEILFRENSPETAFGKIYGCLHDQLYTLRYGTLLGILEEKEKKEYASEEIRFDLDQYFKLPLDLKKELLKTVESYIGEIVNSAPKALKKFEKLKKDMNVSLKAQI